ncbi:hypothetical protein CLI92_09040 [Vandammella animalimorsus]|uniref:Uncharacterized protein n=1 Tax=Vandammella animalimorsus TaxID=2029117 RepID=A0A2A2T4X3_9BURK|nr:hypothetical protein [Vandammella animalimorsus]PAX16468.1 hypothetical protein CLI92_09040 [Vandammella animalimorsus]PAX18883.1 hypothetical protein CLI93_11120 [Vandammella animalimorsus]
MPVIRIDEFGGIAPRVPPRALAEGAAQTNHDLMASAREFRPLQDDRSVGAAPVGARTLYRMSRSAQGVLRTGAEGGWLALEGDFNHVASQLNDDATERTVVTDNSGVQPPRVIDVTGADRLLGVPAPTKPGLAAQMAPQFTREDAQVWFEAEFLPRVTEIVKQCIWGDPSQDAHQRLCRWVNGKPWAGAFAAHGYDQDALYPWMMAYHVEVNRKGSIGMAGLFGRQPTSDKNIWRVLVPALPFWGHIPAPAGHSAPKLVERLQTIEHPTKGTALFDASRAAAFDRAVREYLSPDSADIQPLRMEIDTKLQELRKILDGEYVSKLDESNYDDSTRPKPPARLRHINFGGPNAQTDPEWEEYDRRFAQWREQERQRLLRNEDVAGTREAAVANAQRLIAEIETASKRIEAMWFERLEGAAQAVREGIGTQVTKGEDGQGLLEVDEDRRIETRFYMVTYVTDWGEESAPSPVSDLVEIDQNDSVTITCPAPPAGRHITKWRIYRSNSGTEQAAFQFVEELLATQLSFTDSVKNEQLGEVCPTIGWAEPPYRWDSRSPASIKPPRGDDPYLRGVVAMPNGIVAGFVDNFVAFCEPYHPYAWPVEYQITTETPIVGLGVFGQTLFVGTMANPYLISGADSASMSADKLDADQACVSRRSIVSVGSGVVYASPDGLCLASGRGVELLTAAFFSREEWQALRPAQIFAAAHDGAYYFWAGGQCYVLDVPSRKLGTVSLPATAVFRDRITDHLYVAAGGQVRQAFAVGRRTGRWRSRVHVLPAQAPFAWLKVVGDQSPAQPVTVRWFGDGALRYEVQVSSTRPVRLPPGRWLEHELEIEGQPRVTQLVLASSTEEMQSV